MCIFETIVISGQRFFEAVNLELIEVYNKRIDSGELVPDTDQLKTLQALQDLTTILNVYQPKNSWSFFNIFHKKKSKLKVYTFMEGSGVENLC